MCTLPQVEKVEESVLYFSDGWCRSVLVQLRLSPMIVVAVFGRETIAKWFRCIVGVYPDDRFIYGTFSGYFLGDEKKRCLMEGQVCYDSF